PLRIHHGGVEERFAHGRHAAVLDAAVEAGAIARVTGRPADLLDFQQDRVGVAVEIDLLDFLDMAALLALAPEPIPAPAEVDGAPAPQGLVIGRAVHVREHQDLAGPGV